MSRLWQNALVVLFVLLSGGCAIHYFDSETGTEHLWGFGHMQMKVSPENEGVQAVVHGTETAGLSVGSTPSQKYISLGWQRLAQLQVVQADTAVRLEWPSSDFFSVRVGSEFPHTAQQSAKPAAGDNEKEAGE